MSNVIYMSNRNAIFPLGLIRAAMAFCSTKYFIEGETFVVDDLEYKVRNATQTDLLKYANDALIGSKRDLEDCWRNTPCDAETEGEMALSVSENQKTLHAIEQATGSHFYTMMPTSLRPVDLKNYDKPIYK